jgi:diaminopimelate epimerase
MTLRFAKAHAYGNDFLYVERALVPEASSVQLARAMCDRHTGIGADGLIFYTAGVDEANMTLLNADGSRAEVSGNGLRGLAALLLLRTDERNQVTINTEAGRKQLRRVGREGSRQTFRASMGPPTDLRQVTLMAGGERLSAVVLNMGNPQCIVLGSLPDDDRFHRLGAALEHHSLFPDRSNVEFVSVETPSCVRIRIWERGCGPTQSSGTGSCASAVAAAAFGGAERDVQVVAPGGAQRVEWLEDSVYLTGWAEVVSEGDWLRDPSERAAR